MATYYSIHVYTNEIKKQTTDFKLDSNAIKTLAEAKKQLKHNQEMSVKVLDEQIQELIERRNQLAQWAGLDNAQIGI